MATVPLVIPWLEYKAKVLSVVLLVIQAMTIMFKVYDPRGLLSTRGEEVLMQIQTVWGFVRKSNIYLQFEVLKPRVQFSNQSQ